MSSFAYDLKSDLCRHRLQMSSNSQPLLYGMLLFGRSFGAGAIELHTEHETAADLYLSLLKQEIDPALEPVKKIRRRKNENSVFCISLESEAERKKVLNFFSHGAEEPNLRIHPEILQEEGAFSAFLCGAYLSCGNVTDPSKGYHLEFVSPHYALGKDLEQLLNETFLSPKLTQRRGLTVLYYKESEQIEDLMTMMGAANSSLKLMNIKIYKDVRNKVNRLTNCETANIEKTVNASSAQIEDIQLILEKKGLDYLSEDLRSVAELRLENPDYSLSELTEAMGETITKSGVNHRLKRISKLADQLRSD